jgi:hypothetical protein
MSAARTALSGLLDALAAAVRPAQVDLHDDAVPPGTAGVTVRPVSLDRVGRSRRDGPLLDLQLTVEVTSTGPQSLEWTEQMLTAVEQHERYSAGPLGTPGQLGFTVRVPVPVRLGEPTGPLVREPLRVETQVAWPVSGIVVDGHGRGVSGATVRSAFTGTTAACDAQGRFRLLAGGEPAQDFVVEVRGRTRSITASADELPVLIRWDGERS